MQVIFMADGKKKDCIWHVWKKDGIKKSKHDLFLGN